VLVGDDADNLDPLGFRSADADQNAVPDGHLIRAGLLSQQLVEGTAAGLIAWRASFVHPRQKLGSSLLASPYT
jgi:hypothetical protein